MNQDIVASGNVKRIKSKYTQFISVRYEGGMLNKNSWMLVLICSISAASFNDVKVVYANQGMDSRFLSRVVNAGYTHIMFPYAVDSGSTEWEDGLYIKPDTSAGLRLRITSNFETVRRFNLKLIPFVTVHSRWAGHWRNANNPAIEFEPIIRDEQSFRLLRKALAPTHWDMLVHPLLTILSATFPTSKTDYSGCPVLAPDHEPFSRTFESFIRDVVAEAYRQYQINTGDTSNLEFIHIGSDEPISYDQEVSHSNKFLVGQSEIDREWIYDNVPDHGGTEIECDSIWVNRIDSITGGTITEQIPVIYKGPPDSIGRSYLLAAAIRQRVSEVKRYLPETKVILFSDILDPEFLGRTYKTSVALDLLDTATITYTNSAGTSITGPLSDHLVLMPWKYLSNYNEPTRGEVTDAYLGYTGEQLKRVTKDLGCVLGCGFLPFPFLATACISKCATYIVTVDRMPDNITTELLFESAVFHYNPRNTFSAFTNAGFPVIYMWAYEWGAPYLYQQSIQSAFNYADAARRMAAPGRDSLMLGYSVAFWPEDSMFWDFSNPNLDPYDQPAPFNAIEIMAAAANNENFAPNTGTANSLFFGNLILLPGDSANPPVYMTSQPITSLDYLCVTRDVINSGRLDHINDIETAVHLHEAMLFCNELSKREGKDTVYSIRDLEYMPVTHRPGGNYQPYKKRPLVQSMQFSVDLSRNGYRLPTRAEWEAGYYDTTGQFVFNPSQREWVGEFDTVAQKALSFIDPSTGGFAARYDQPGMNHFAFRIVCAFPHTMTVTGGTPKTRNPYYAAADSLIIKNFSVLPQHGTALFEAGRLIRVLPETGFHNASQVVLKTNPALLTKAKP